MPSGLSTLSLPQIVSASFALLPLVHAGVLSDLHHNYFAPTPAPEDGPAFSAHALRNKKYLPIQVGGIVGAYGVALIFVAIALLCLSNTRREHLLGGDEEDEADAYASAFEQICTPRFPTEPNPFPLAGRSSGGQVPNFSYKSPTRSEFSGTPYVHPPTSPGQNSGPGVDLQVDQAVVAADREMAQNQLEAMYKHVMEHEEAKEKGIILESPVVGPANQRGSAMSKKSKPTSLNLSSGGEEKTRSRASSFFSSLRSPRKSKPRGLNISSPIMTPQTGTFPRHEDQEMSTIPPRHYAPAAPPPVPTEQGSHIGQARSSGIVVPLTPPELSPTGVQSIDGRLGAQLAQISTSKDMSPPPAEGDPESAVSQHSQAPLLGLPTSPKPGVTFGTLPSSPRPGARFQRGNAPSAVRTGGTLPLRAYEPSLSSPSAVGQTTKQTVFERRGPLSPGGGRTPFTANAVPYSPYQPHTPCVPITPSLVTKEDRKRMKKMVPKTPTVEMVRSADDMW
ncbi:hypothetical protein ISF_06422 [Cordyceps fumosorosea ARSEF 2679]|uniref:Uncharacterized protein n=1 Tax=Cordyceps fumosorosea (strain ARSEF 2679) TaxID=1081104 RepID=A0A167SCD3_CORFA|nr:hypothetical protein ISF_06422 [Cordyceps fumosorosea ARSEF 2679]OAA59487.1 hypothetical protein ISF_06422 [Cordyceps fumosorosea ARSEF 2679]